MSALVPDSAALAFVQAAIADPSDTTTLLVAADWYGERGEPLREEWCRLTVEKMRGNGNWRHGREEVRARHMIGALSDAAAAALLLAVADTVPDPLTARLRDLEAKLSAWPCPEYIAGREYLECPVCGAAGDPENFLAGLTLTWSAGYPVSVTLPTLADAVRQYVQNEGSEPGDEPMPEGTVLRWQSTPRLAALCQTPPWGVPLEAVMVGDREPLDVNGGQFIWFDGRSENVGPGPHFHHLPPVVWDMLDLPLCEHRRHLKQADTPDAAKFALGKALVAFGRRG